MNCTCQRVSWFLNIIDNDLEIIGRSCFVIFRSSDENNNNAAKGLHAAAVSYHLCYGQLFV